MTVSLPSVIVTLIEYSPNGTLGLLKSGIVSMFAESIFMKAAIEVMSTLTIAVSRMSSSNSGGNSYVHLKDDHCL